MPNPFAFEQKGQTPRTKKTVSEIKCTCGECGKIWHYLKSEEQAMNMQSCGNLMMGCGTCCSPLSGYYYNKSMESSMQSGEKFRKCPSCGSINIKKEEHNVEC